MKSGTSTAGTKTVFVSRTWMILVFPRFSGSWIFSGFGVSHFALVTSLDVPQVLFDLRFLRIRVAVSVSRETQFGAGLKPSKSTT